MPGVDGDKMSKSYDNTLAVFEEPGPLKKQIMRIKTDSRPMEESKDPDTDHLYQLYSLFVDDAEREEMAALYRRGGFGYGEVKKTLAELAEILGHKTLAMVKRYAHLTEGHTMNVIAKMTERFLAA